MFDEDCENHISLDDFDEEGTANAFMHAMATLAPSVVYKKLTREEIDSIGFNHIANRLCFQFGKNN